MEPKPDRELSNFGSGSCSTQIRPAAQHRYCLKLFCHISRLMLVPWFAWWRLTLADCWQVGEVSGSPSLMGASLSQSVEEQQQQSLTIPLDQARPPVKKPDIPRSYIYTLLCLLCDTTQCPILPLFPKYGSGFGYGSRGMLFRKCLKGIK